MAELNPGGVSGAGRLSLGEDTSATTAAEQSESSRPYRGVSFVKNFFRKRSTKPQPNNTRVTTTNTPLPPWQAVFVQQEQQQQRASKQNGQKGPTRSLGGQEHKPMDVIAPIPPGVGKWLDVESPPGSVRSPGGLAEMLKRKEIDTATPYCADSSLLFAYDDMSKRQFPENRVGKLPHLERSSSSVDHRRRRQGKRGDGSHEKHGRQRYASMGEMILSSGESREDPKASARIRGVTFSDVDLIIDAETEFRRHSLHQALEGVSKPMNLPETVADFSIPVSSMVGREGGERSTSSSHDHCGGLTSSTWVEGGSHVAQGRTKSVTKYCDGALPLSCSNDSGSSLEYEGTRRKAKPHRSFSSCRSCGGGDFQGEAHMGLPAYKSEDGGTANLRSSQSFTCRGSDRYPDHSSLHSYTTSLAAQLEQQRLLNASLNASNASLRVESAQLRQTVQDFQTRQDELQSGNYILTTKVRELEKHSEMAKQLFDDISSKALERLQQLLAERKSMMREIDGLRARFEEVKGGGRDGAWQYRGFGVGDGVAGAAIGPAPHRELLPPLQDSAFFSDNRCDCGEERIGGSPDRGRWPVQGKITANRARVVETGRSPCWSGGRSKSSAPLGGPAALSPLRAFRGRSDSTPSVKWISGIAKTSTPVPAENATSLDTGVLDYSLPPSSHEDGLHGVETPLALAHYAPDDRLVSLPRGVSATPFQQPRQATSPLALPEACNPKRMAATQLCHRRLTRGPAMHQPRHVTETQDDSRSSPSQGPVDVVGVTKRLRRRKSKGPRSYAETASEPESSLGSIRRRPRLHSIAGVSQDRRRRPRELLRLLPSTNGDVDMHVPSESGESTVERPGSQKGTMFGNGESDRFRVDVQGAAGGSFNAADGAETTCFDAAGDYGEGCSVGSDTVEKRRTKKQHAELQRSCMVSGGYQRPGGSPEFENQRCRSVTPCIRAADSTDSIKPGALLSDLVQDKPGLMLRSKPNPAPHPSESALRTEELLQALAEASLGPVKPLESSLWRPRLSSIDAVAPVGYSYPSLQGLKTHFSGGSAGSLRHFTSDPPTSTSPRGPLIPVTVDNDGGAPFSWLRSDSLLASHVEVDATAQYNGLSHQHPFAGARAHPADDSTTTETLTTEASGSGGEKEGDERGGGGGKTG